MWAIICNNDNEYLALKEVLLKYSQYAEPIIGTGAKVLQCENKQYPSLVQLTSRKEDTYKIFQWVEQNIVPKAIINTGIIDYYGPQKIESTLFLPEVCCRQAGRLDIGFSPVLWEDLKFSEKYLKIFHELFKEQIYQSTFNKLLSTEVSFESIHNEWIQENLGVVANDLNTAQLFLAGNKFGTPTLCFKVFSFATNPIEQLNIAWNKIFEKKLWNHLI